MHLLPRGPTLLGFAWVTFFVLIVFPRGSDSTLFVSSVSSPSTLGSECSAWIQPTTSSTGGLISMPNCSITWCSWNEAISFCTQMTLAQGVSTWAFRLRGGTYSELQSSISISPTSSVRSIRIQPANVEENVVWVGQNATLRLLVQNPLTSIQVVGVSFVRNSALFIQMSQASSGTVLIQSCVFRESLKDRALLLASGASITVQNCSFVNNVGFGGGRIIGISRPVRIIDCYFSENSLIDGAGGGLLIIASSAPVMISGSFFSNNSVIGSQVLSAACLGVTVGCGGGGVAIRTLGLVTIQQSIFYGNQALGLQPPVGFSGGGGIWVRSGSCVVSDSYVSRNSAIRNGVPLSQANGGGGALILSLTGSIEVKNVSASLNRASQNGAQGGSNGNSSGSGGGAMLLFAATVSSSITVNGGVFTDNSAILNGEGLNTSVFLDSGVGSSHNGGGAFWIWSQSNGEISIVGGKYSRNSAIWNGQGASYTESSAQGGPYNGGGAFMITSIGDVFISDACASENTALSNGIGGSHSSLHSGPGSFRNGGGFLFVYTSSGSVYLSNSTFSSNVAFGNGGGGSRNLNRGTGGWENGGGGVWIFSNVLVSVKNTTWIRNLAHQNGNGGSFSGEGDGLGGSFNGGGALWLYIPDGSLFLSLAHFYQNSASGNGCGGNFNLIDGRGGFRNGGGAILFEVGPEVSTLMDVRLVENTALSNGVGGRGSIYGDGSGGMENGGGAIWAFSTSSSIYFSKVWAFKNQAIDNGRGGSINLSNENGGSRNGGGALWIFSEQDPNFVTDSEFHNNSVSKCGSGGSGSKLGSEDGGSFNGGGAIWSFQTSVSRSLFLSNVANSNGGGGAICISQCPGGNLNGGGALFAIGRNASSLVSSVQNLFVSNIAMHNGQGGSSAGASLSSGGILCGGGAAILLRISLQRSRFFDNSAVKSGTVSSRNSVGTDGTNNGGGAVLALGAVLSECFFSNNSVSARILSSSGNGGGIRIASNTRVQNSFFQQNIASHRGGAIASGSGDHNLLWNVTFLENRAFFDGGAVVSDVSDSSLAIGLSRFTKNSVVASRGGALAVVASLAALETETCTFSNNFAIGEGGAVAVIVEGASHLSIKDEYEGNSAGTFGGVFYSSSSSFLPNDSPLRVDAARITVQEARFFNNSAGFGGVVMTDNRGTASISSSFALGNRALSVSGGFAHLTVRSMMNLTNLLLVHNSAIVSAGSIYQEHFSLLSVRNVSFVNSTSSSNGAVECVHDTVAYFSEGTRFEGNRALTDSTGALYIEGNAYAFLSDVSFVRNRATSFSGALSAYDTSRLVLDRCSFIGNHASSFGGAFSLFGSSSLHMLSGSSCIQNMAMGGAGGCGWVSASAKLIVSGTQFMSNSASQGDGGALSVSSTVAWQVSNSSFSRNRAWRGGALSFNLSSIWSASEVIVLQSSIRSSEFSNNIAFRPSASELSNENNLLGSGGGGAFFFNLPSQSSASIASLAWSSWTLKNIFSGNSAVYGPSVASVGLSPFFETSQGRIVSPCQPISSFQTFRQIMNASSLVQTMPGVTVSLRLGICDAFGQPISTVIGATLGQRFNQSTSEQIVQTSTNGTGVWQSNLPPLLPGRWFALSSSLIGVGEGLSFPRLVLSWPASNCAPFFGRSTSSGCTVCSSSEYSISSSNLPCQLCSQLTVGAVCESQPLSKVLTSFSSASVSLLSEADFLTVTVLRMENQYWPALQVSLPEQVATIVPISCPFDFCSRGGVDFFVTGVDDSLSYATTSNPSLMCREGSFRDPSSILCGECLEGYSEWNNECYECPNGPQPAFVVLFLLQLIGWTILQLILSRNTRNGNLAAILIFLTQSIGWFTYPRDLISTVENLVYFRFYVPGVKQCYFDVDSSTKLFLEVLLPMLYFLTLLMLYLIHMSFWWCFSPNAGIHDDNARHADLRISSSSSNTIKSLWLTVRNFLVSSASPLPYQKATALLILGAFPSILSAVFSVWSCREVFVGTSTLSVVALSPSVLCGTRTYWLWNLFFIPVVIVVIAFVLLIVFATRHARDIDRKIVDIKASIVEISDSQFSRDSPSAFERFGILWKAPFRDEVPWWTATELFVRLFMIAVFSLTITRIPEYTSLLLSCFILCWMVAHFVFSPYREKTTDRLVVVAQFSMLLMAITAGSGIDSRNKVILIFSFYGFAALLLIARIVYNLVMSLRHRWRCTTPEDFSIQSPDLSETLLEHEASL